MIHLHFPDAATSPTGQSPLSLRVKLTPRTQGPGSVASVHFKHRADELTAAALSGYQRAGAWIETDNPASLRRLREVFGPGADIRPTVPGATHAAD